MKRFIIALCLTLCATVFLTGCSILPFEISDLPFLPKNKEQTTESKNESTTEEKTESESSALLAEEKCPYDYSQKILLTVKSGTSNATMQLMNWEKGDWQSVYSCKATVGKNGAGYSYGEGKGITPVGTFKLGVVLCRTAPGNNWPYRIVDSKTCIVDDTASAYYNTIQNSDSLSSNVSKDYIGNTIISGRTSQCIYIEHNGNGITSENVVPGKGSAITICGRNSTLAPTLGCVDIASVDLTNIISKMDYNNNPHIEIVVG